MSSVSIVEDRVNCFPKFLAARLPQMCVSGPWFHPELARQLLGLTKEKIMRENIAPQKETISCNEQKKCQTPPLIHNDGFTQQQTYKNRGIAQLFPSEIYNERNFFSETMFSHFSLFFYLPKLDIIFFLHSF